MPHPPPPLAGGERGTVPKSTINMNKINGLWHNREPVFLSVIGTEIASIVPR
jgi:hypothetical protein